LAIRGDDTRPRRRKRGGGRANKALRAGILGCWCLRHVVEFLERGERLLRVWWQCVAGANFELFQKGLTRPSNRYCEGRGEGQKGEERKAFEPPFIARNKAVYMVVGPLWD
jgi:hypothetical protein